MINIDMDMVGNVVRDEGEVLWDATPEQLEEVGRAFVQLWYSTFAHFDVPDQPHLKGFFFHRDTWKRVVDSIPRAEGVHEQTLG